MKPWLIGIGVPLAVMAATASVWACDPEQEGSKQDCIVKILASATTEDGEASVIQPVVAYVLAGDEEDEGEEWVAGRPWLGVQLGDVASPLSAHLGIDGKGVMVLNIAEDSPANEAGLEVNDLIMSIDYEEVPSDVIFLVNKIGSHKPGDRIVLNLLRNGEPQTVQVELGERPTPDSLNWKLERSPQTEIEERVFTRGRVLHKGPDGKWLMQELEDLGDLEELKNLVPPVGVHSVQVIVDGNSKSIKRVFQRDNVTITVEQVDDGPITVARSSDNGQNVTITKFSDEEELRNGDPEAYELIHSAGKPFVWSMKLDGMDELSEHLQHVYTNVGVDVERLQQEIMASQEQWHERMQEAHERLQEAMQQLQQSTQFNLGWEQFGSAGALVPGGEIELSSSGKPVYSFHETANGGIEVRIRKGDSELVQTYSSEQELERRAPQLAEKYRDLKESDEMTPDAEE